MLNYETIKQLEEAGMLTNAGVLPADTQDVLADLTLEELNILLAIKQPLDVAPDESRVKGYAGRLRDYAARLQGMTFAAF